MNTTRDNVRQLRPLREPWDVTVHAAVDGVRFVTPGEFQAGLPASVHRGLLKTIVAEALAAAADDEGVLLDFNKRDFFDTHVAAVMNRDLDEEEAATPLVYDRFTAMALMDCLHSLMLDDGLLANRGNGDTHDYRLTLP